MRSGRARKITGATLMVTGFALSLANELWLLRHGGILTRSTPGAWLLGLSWLLILGGAYLFWRGPEDSAKAYPGRILHHSNAHVFYFRPFRYPPSTPGYLLFYF